MANDYLQKLNRLSPAIKAKLSAEDFLMQLDELGEQYGVKAVLLLLDLLVGILDYADLAKKLKADYGFNDFLAEEVKGKFGELIKQLGEELKEVKPPAAPVQPSPLPAHKNVFNSSLGQISANQTIISKTGALPQPVKATAMTFSREDEEEIKQYLGSAAAAEPIRDYSAATKKIIASFGYQAGDEVMIKRLENIIASRLKGVRDDLEIKENLIKSRKVGGMEFSEADAEKLLKIIKLAVSSGVNSIDTGLTLKKSLGIESEKTDDDLKIELEDGLPVIRLPEDNKGNVKYPISNIKEESLDQLPSSTNNVKIQAVKASEIKIQDLPSASPAPFIAEKRIPETVLNSKTVGRPNLDDVKFSQRLMGPIDELSAMTLIDFRRLAADPEAAVNKVKEKIDLLEEQGLAKRISGINGWNQNEINRFYRLLGQLGMTEGKTIEEVIKERLIAGKPTLTLDEFQAVMELNRALRY